MKYSFRISILFVFAQLLGLSFGALVWAEQCATQVSEQELQALDQDCKDPPIGSCAVSPTGVGILTSSQKAECEKSKQVANVLNPVGSGALHPLEPFERQSAEFLLALHLRRLLPSVSLLSAGLEQSLEASLRQCQREGVSDSNSTQALQSLKGMSQSTSELVELIQKREEVVATAALNFLSVVEKEGGIDPEWERMAHAHPEFSEFPELEGLLSSPRSEKITWLSFSQLSWDRKLQLVKELQAKQFKQSVDAVEELCAHPRNAQGAVFAQPNLRRQLVSCEISDVLSLSTQVVSRKRSTLEEIKRLKCQGGPSQVSSYRKILGPLSKLDPLSDAKEAFEQDFGLRKLLSPYRERLEKATEHLTGLGAEDLSKLDALSPSERYLFYRNLNQLPAPDQANFKEGLSRLKCNHALNQEEGCYPVIRAFMKQISLSVVRFHKNALFSDLASEKKVLLVVREPTEASEVLQGEGLDTKPKEIWNKSSVLGRLNGLIPMNGYAGKKGDALRDYLKKCPGLPESQPKGCSSEELARLQREVENETRMANELIKTKSGSFSKKEIRRTSVLHKGNKLEKIEEVLVYTDLPNAKMEFKNVTLVKSQHYPLVEYIANSDGVGISGDEDLMLVSQPKKGNLVNPMRHFEQGKDGPFTGYATPFTYQLLQSINPQYQKRTGNKYALIQHPDEAGFGVNPINDVLKIYTPDKKMTRIDLTYSNLNREKALESYAHILKAASAYSHIPIPTESMIRRRAKDLKESTGIEIDVERTIKDYQKIYDIVYGKKVVEGIQ